MNNPSNYAFLGHNITNLRKDKKLTEGDMAEQLGISIVDYLRLETNPRKSGIELLFRTADVLGVNPAVLIYGEMEPNIMGYIEKNEELKMMVEKLQMDILKLQGKLIDLHNDNQNNKDNG